MEIAVTLPLHEGFSLSSAVKRLPILYPGLSLGKAAGGFVSLVFPAGWAMWEVGHVARGCGSLPRCPRLRALRRARVVP